MQMLFKSFGRFLVIAFLFFGCVTSRKTTAGTSVLKAADLQPYGRYARDSVQLELISSAVHFSFSFEGRGCAVFASLSSWQDHNYLQYELDGVYQKRVRVLKQAKEPIVIEAPTDGRHTITIYKATEAHTGPIYIRQVSGTGLQAIAPSKASLIEFIGNSITCGAASDPSEVPCGTGLYHDQHNAYYAYGPRVARSLGANFILSSVSGIGIYRNWNSDGPVMPEVYRYADFHKEGERLWNFKLYQPKLVSIALGTNDFSNGDGKKERLPFDSAKFVQGYIGFISQVRGDYGDVQLVLLSSAMMNGAKRELLQNCLTAVKNEVNNAHPTNKPIDLFFFAPMQAHGCSGHPNVEEHAKMAEELLPFMKKYF